MMKKSVKLKENIISVGPQSMLEYNFYFPELFTIKKLMKKLQRTHLT